MTAFEVPMVDLAARHRAIAGRVEGAVLEVLRSGRYVGGELVSRAERSLAARFGRAHGVGTQSGTSALSHALLAAGVRAGDEVVVPALSFFATAGAVLRIGALPVVVDVLPDRPLLDPDAVVAALGPAVRGVVPVHLFGDRAELPPLPPEVIVVEDAAQALGRPSEPALGVAQALSLYPTKIVGGAGDGGMVLTDDPALAERVRSLGHHGFVPGRGHERIGEATGGNDRLDAVQAAVVLAHLEELDARVARRREIAAAYDEVLEALPPDPVPRGRGSPVSSYTLCVDDRDRLARHLASRGIDSAVHYHRPLGEQPALDALPAHCRRETPLAQRFCRRALSLPCREGMGPSEVAKVVDALRSAY